MANAKTLTALNSTGAEIKKDELLRNHTSWRVGGPADYFAIAKTEDQLISLYTKAFELNMPVFILGLGCNILVGDKGIRGLVIKNTVKGIEIGNRTKAKITKSNKFRRDETHWRPGFLKLEGINFDIDTDDVVKVKIKSGTVFGYLITYLLNHGVTGLEYFAGIPSTFGAAIWNNIHGGEWLIEDFLKEVEILLPSGEKQVLTAKELGFHYDYSIFHEKEALILGATLLLPLGDVERAKHVAKEWKIRKRNQPGNSAGSNFANISPEERDLAHLDNCGVGYIIDKILDLRGKKVGDAWISEKHAAFIETGENAKATDIVELLNLIQNRTYAELGIKLREEIVRVGEF